MALPDSLNDVMMESLGLQGFTGSLNVRLWDFFDVNGADANAKTLDGKEVTCLQSQTGLTTGNAEELWFDYLGTRGYTGSLNARKYQFWTDGGTFGPVAIIREPTQLMYDDDPVVITVAGGATNPLINMNNQGAQAWTSGDPASTYTAKSGFTLYQQVTIVLTATDPP